MDLPGTLNELTNWSKSTRSICFVYKVSDRAEIEKALEVARAHHLSVIPHGAGHSYTDSALNTAGMVMDVTPMHRILSWDAGQGIISVEPGVTLREVLQITSKDGWWLPISPSIPDVTVGGCAAMNVSGTNAWKCGPFGATILSLDVLLVAGEVRTLMPERDATLFHAFVGSLGLLGIITSITLQLRRIPSGSVIMGRNSAPSLDGIFAAFAEREPHSDFMEAWLDGFADGRRLGRGFVTYATLNNTSGDASSPTSRSGIFDRFETQLARLTAGAARPMLLPAIKIANRASYWMSRLDNQSTGRQRPLFPYTYWPSAAFAGYHRLFPEGVETFQAFVPGSAAPEIFRQLLNYSHRQGYLSVWCIIKQHRNDPYLLSYQVDGFSLELNYQRTAQTAEALQQMLHYMIALVIEAGGRFYLAKDHFLTGVQYRQSIGDKAVDTFLRLKKQYDPDQLLQSDIFRRLF